jgi:uncharacterized protein YdhG (YjbR/CyaY superfamily)
MSGDIMDGNKNTYESVDEYISQFTPKVREKLKMLRKVIKESAPDAEEKISYQMPAYKLNRNLVYFAAFKDHIGFFPTSSGIEAFKKELSGYKTSKGTVQFPLDKPVPYELVSKIVKFRVAEETKLAKSKSEKKK